MICSSKEAATNEAGGGRGGTKERGGEGGGQEGYWQELPHINAVIVKSKNYSEVFTSIDTQIIHARIVILV